MEIIKENIFDFNCDAIMHQCNCFQVMGKGFCKIISRIYPAVKIADLRTKIGDRRRLGTFSKVVVGYLPYQVVYNIYSQYGFGRMVNKRTGICTEYNHLQHGLSTACQDLLQDQHLLNKDEIIVAVPKMIGCIRGSGDIDTVIKIIEGIQEKFNKIKFYACKFE